MIEHPERLNIGDETELCATARRLGQAAADRFDVETAARGVTARLRAHPVETRRTHHWTRAYRLAAAVALIAGALVWLRQGASRDAAPAVALPATVQLADLAEPQLERLLAELDQDLRLDSLPRAGGDLDDVTLDDLTADQLQAVLRSMEG